MTEIKEPTRINKYLALQLGISRREADEYVEHDQVTIDGETADLGAQVTSTSVVAVQGKIISDTAKLVYLALNKPVGYVCSRRKQGDSPTIYKLLPSKYHKLKTVGRLDRNSSGLILLTNDGDFTHRMTHPKFQKIKVYGVHLDRELEPLHQQMISDHGVLLEDGLSKFELQKIKDDRRDMWLIRMHEGRNRQIRRTFAALGYTVTALHRTDFGPYHLGELKPGEFEITTKK